MSVPAPATILLSSHGTVLCRDASGDLGLRLFAEAGTEVLDAASLTTEREGEGRLVTVAAHGRFLRTEDGGRTLRFAGASVASRELFLPLAAADRAVLASLLEGRWIRRPAARAGRVRAPVASDAAPVRLRAPFQLECGDLVLDLPAQLPLTGHALTGHARPLRVSTFRGGLGHVELCRYRPLVVVTAFRDEATVGALATALGSLVGEGGYGGDVLVLTDLGAPEVERALSVVAAGRQVVVRLAPTDRIGRIVARMAFSFIETCRLYQPILCVDAGAIFTAPIEPVLLTIATADALRVCPQAGGRDDEAAPGPHSGLEHAILALPNLVFAEDRLRAWRQLMAGGADADRDTIADLAGLDCSVLDTAGAIARGGAGLHDG